MRDDSKKWGLTPESEMQFDAEGIALRRIFPNRLVLVSGPSLPGDEKLVGWPDLADAESYRLSLRRDRMLIVNGPAAEEGWDAQKSLAISDATGAYAVFELSGAQALALLKRGAELSLDTPSRSVLRRLFGLEVTLYRYEAEDCFRLHVERGLAQAMFESLSAALSHMPHDL